MYVTKCLQKSMYYGIKIMSENTVYIHSSTRGIAQAFHFSILKKKNRLLFTCWNYLHGWYNMMSVCQIARKY